MANNPKTPKDRRTGTPPTAANPTRPLTDLRAAKQEWSKRLIARRSMPVARALTSAISPDPDLNLVGVGVGEKLVDNRRTGVMAVKFLVRAKYNEKHISEKHVLPK